MEKKIYFTIALIAIALTSGGCKKDEGSPGTNEVWIKDMAFNPTSISVAVNTTITWTNKDGNAHTVTSNNGIFDSSSLNNGATFSYKFDSVGTFNYHCSIHSSMTAKVVVQ